MGRLCLMTQAEDFFADAGRGMRAGGFSGACVCFDDESLPSASGDSGGEFVYGDGVVPECLYAPDQHASPVVGASLWRALQGDRGGGGKLVLPLHGKSVNVTIHLEIHN